ncbi:MAG TPA: MMPL family transporter, partial [Nocardioidaceae bacterium]|nr:MMPL family transporter [Nocardioidaceae bacterium]
ASLSVPSDSDAAQEAVQELRERLDTVSPDVLVGGQTAIALDTNQTATEDRNTILPTILLVIFVVLALLLRAMVAPLLLLLANVLSFAATLGVSALVFNHVLDFPGGDPSITLFGFVFLVALGIDYSIFLMTRAREEAIKQGTRPGMLKALAATGGVITSAGIVLAATFAALGVLPILFLVQIAFIVAFGVLLDTFIVRSLLVPAMSYDVGRLIWWPSRLGRGSRFRR